MGVSASTAMRSRAFLMISFISIYAVITTKLRKVGGLCISHLENLAIFLREFRFFGVNSHL
jgi:hypothetical protein